MEWWKILLLVLGGVIVLSIIMHYINRSYRIKYDYNLFGGGLAFLVIIAAGVGAGFLIAAEKTGIAVVCAAVALILLILVIVRNCKKCGAGAGLLALIFQLIFCIPCLILLLEFFSKGYNSTNLSSNYRTERKIREARRNMGYDEDERRRNSRNDYYDNNY